jgi:hypothetical protein
MVWRLMTMSQAKLSFLHFDEESGLLVLVCLRLVEQLHACRWHLSKAGEYRRRVQYWQSVTYDL